MLLGTPNVAALPAANFNSAYRVIMNIQRFETVPGKSVLIDAVCHEHLFREHFRARKNIDIIFATRRAHFYMHAAAIND
jgi:hypothetical protein